MAKIKSKVSKKSKSLNSDWEIIDNDLPIAKGGDLIKLNLNDYRPSFVSESTGVKRQNIQKPVPQKKQEQTIKQSERQSIPSKAAEVLLHPLTAISNYSQKGYIPDNFSKGELNPIDYAMDAINPAFYVKAAGNTLKSLVTPQTYTDIPKTLGAAAFLAAGENAPSELNEAAFRTLGVAGDALVSFPFLGAGAIKGFSETAKRSPFLREQIYKAIEPVGYGAREKILKSPKTWIRNTFLSSPEERALKLGKGLISGLGDKTDDELIRVGKNRLDAFRTGLRLPQKFDTFENIGEDLYRIKNMNPSSRELGSVYSDLLSDEIKKLDYYTGEDPLISISKRFDDAMMPSLQKKDKIFPYSFFRENVLKQPYDPWIQKRLVESSKNPNFTHSVYDIDRRGIMGSFRWDVNKPKYNEDIHFQSNDIWNLNPWEKRGQATVEDKSDILHKHYFKPFENIEALSLMGGKPFKIQNNFIVDPKNYRIKKSFKQGGSVWEIVNYIKQEGGNIPVDPMGYWNPDNYDEPAVIIPSNEITMQGIDYPIYGEDNTGYAQMMYPGEDYIFPGDYVTEYPLPEAGGGYRVIRSNERKGKTHKVIGPDGTVKFFGDSKLGQHPKDPARKKAFYARHKKNLAKNPYFRAFARKTWAEGGELDFAQEGIKTGKFEPKKGVQYTASENDPNYIKYKNYEALKERDERIKNAYNNFWKDFQNYGDVENFLKKGQGIEMWGKGLDKWDPNTPYPSIEDFKNMQGIDPIVGTILSLTTGGRNPSRTVLNYNFPNEELKNQYYSIIKPFDKELQSIDAEASKKLGFDLNSIHNGVVMENVGTDGVTRLVPSEKFKDVLPEGDWETYCPACQSGSHFRNIEKSVKAPKEVGLLPLAPGSYYTRERQPGERFSALYDSEGNKYSAVDYFLKNAAPHEKRKMFTLDPVTRKIAFKNPETGEEEFKFGGMLPDLAAMAFGGLQTMQTGGTRPPIYVNDPNDPRLRAYNDSSNLYKAYIMQDKLMGPNYNSENTNKIYAPPISFWSTKNLKEARVERIVPGLENYGPLSEDFQNERDMFTNNFFATDADKKLINYYKSLGFNDDNIMYHTSADVVHPTIKPTGSYHDGSAWSPIYKKPVQPVKFKPTEFETRAPLFDEFKPTMTSSRLEVPTYKSTPIRKGGDAYWEMKEENGKFYQRPVNINSSDLSRKYGETWLPITKTTYNLQKKREVEGLVPQRHGFNPATQAVENYEPSAKLARQAFGGLHKAQDGFYNMQRALELGYNPDDQGHWPSVDSETGMWLKSKEHPTAWMEYLYGYTLNPEVQKNFKHPVVNPEGYFGENQLQYIPKQAFGGNLILEKYQGGGSVWEIIE